jgi:predicted acyltransferase
MQIVRPVVLALIGYLAAEWLEAVAGRTVAMIATAVVFALCCAILAVPSQPR